MWDTRRRAKLSLPTNRVIKTPHNRNVCHTWYYAVLLRKNELFYMRNITISRTYDYLVSSSSHSGISFHRMTTACILWLNNAIFNHKLHTTFFATNASKLQHFCTFRYWVVKSNSIRRRETKDLSNHFQRVHCLFRSPCHQSLGIEETLANYGNEAIKEMVEMRLPFTTHNPRPLQELALLKKSIKYVVFGWLDWTVSESPVYDVPVT